VTQKPGNQKKSSEGVGCTLILIVLGIMGVAAYDELFKPDSEKLATQYKMPKERVYAQAKPHGCAYNDAPLGDKHCRYEKHIIVYAKNGLVIEKDGSHLTECPSCAVTARPLVNTIRRRNKKRQGTKNENASVTSPFWVLYP